MEAIPLTLAHNAGMDALGIMAQLKAKHCNSDVCPFISFFVSSHFVLLFTFSYLYCLANIVLGEKIWS